MLKATRAAEQHIISHNSDYQVDLNTTRQRLQDTAILTLPLEETLNLLNQLNEFDLGQFLLKNKGLNGYWTSYVILHAPTKELRNPLENWMIHQAPVVKATRERFYIFQEQLQKHVKSNMTLTSIPCGLMDDLLLLDYSNTENVHLVGIDLDNESIELAQGNASMHMKEETTSFMKKDAWNLGVQEQYDLITSNGLNIYESDDVKVTDLYKEFYKALKPGGTLITSFLTPPPPLAKDSPWENFNSEDVKKQKAIFGDILQATWQCFRTEIQTRKQLIEAGFIILDIIYDSQGMFPTILAQKQW